MKKRTDWKRKYEGEVAHKMLLEDKFKRDLSKSDERLEEAKKGFNNYGRFVNVMMVVFAIIYVVTILLFCLRVQVERNDHITDIHRMYVSQVACEEKYEQKVVEITHRVDPAHSIFDCCYPESCAEAVNNPVECQCEYLVQCDANVTVW